MIGKPAASALPATARIDAFLDARRARVAIGVGIAGAVTLTPFTINNILQGRVALGVATCAVIACLSVNAIAGLRGRAAPIPARIIFLPVLLALLMSIAWQGIVGILWTFPALLLIHFILDTRTANLYNGTMVLAAAPMIYLQYDAAAAVRTAATLSLVMVFANIFSRLSDNQTRQDAEQRERLDLLVRATSAGTLEWITATEETIYSPRLKEMLGYAPDADTSAWRSFLDFIHPDDRQRIAVIFRDQLRDRGVKDGVRRLENRDYRVLRADGSVLWIHAEAIALTGPDGNTERYIASFIDVTERQRQEEALRASRDQVEAQARQLEEQNRALTEAIRGREEVERMAQHDIRTPLNSIVAVPRLLRESPRLAHEEKELLGVVERAAFRILNLVNLTIDLYRMERGSYRLRPHTVDLLGIVDAVAQDLHAHAASKEVRIELRVNGEPPAADERVNVRGEELLCYSIVANLAKNALEASPEGAVVTLDIESGAAQLPDIVLRVHNRGAVPESIRGVFFEKYATAGKQGGSGIGTYSARLMARVQNGELEMSTSEEHGTTLRLRLAAALPADRDDKTIPLAHALRAAPLPLPLPEARVLLVDDDEYNLVFLRSLLPSPPLTLETAINGRVAVEAALARRPDVIFMDLAMPVMNGFDALAAIRRRQAGLGVEPSRVVAFSSYDDDVTRRRALEAGFDRYLNKPARRDELHAVVCELTGTLPSTPWAATQALGGDEITVDADLQASMPGFLASRRALIERLREAAAGERRDELHGLAHQLAGSFALYGFLRAAEMSRALQAASAGASTATLSASVAALAEHLERARIRFAGLKETGLKETGLKETT